MIQNSVVLIYLYNGTGTKIIQVSLPKAKMNPFLSSINKHFRLSWIFTSPEFYTLNRLSSDLLCFFVTSSSTLAHVSPPSSMSAHVSPQDKVAAESLPLQGFTVKLSEPSEGGEASSVFQLYHKKTLYYTFIADDQHTARRSAPCCRTLPIILSNMYYIPVLSRILFNMMRIQWS